MSRIWKDEWKYYQKLVRELTEEKDLSLLENHNKRGYKNYHLDHIVPIQQGFYMNINPHLISSYENFEFIPHTDNMKKGISLNDKSYKLLEKWGIDIDEQKTIWRKSWKNVVHSERMKLKELEVKEKNDTLVKKYNIILEENQRLKEENQRLKEENRVSKELVDKLKDYYYIDRIRRKNMALQRMSTKT